MVLTRLVNYLKVKYESTRTRFGPDTRHPQPDCTLVFTDARGRRLDHQADLELAGWLDQHQGWSGGEFDSHYARLHQGEWAVFS